MPRKKPLSEKEILKQKYVYATQPFQVAQGKDHHFVKTHRYMVYHRNYIKMSSNAKVVLSYMYMVAFWNYDKDGYNEYLYSQTFDFSTTYLEVVGVMNKLTAMRAMQELEHYGFIERVNTTGKGKGITQRWRFSSKWMTGERPYFKQDKRRSIKPPS